MPKPFVVVELDRPRKIRFGLNQLVLLEEKLGIPLSEINERQMGVKEFRLLLWAGLVHEDPSLTPEAVGNLVDQCDVDLTMLMAKVGEALNAAFGTSRTGGEVPKNLLATPEGPSA